MTRVLVTGTRGMLGSEVVLALARSCDVTGADIDDFDLTDPEATRCAVRAVAPDVVVNCAGYTDVDGSEANRELAFAVNAAGAGNLAREAVSLGAYMVHLSTDYVFDGKKGGPYNEDDEPHPLSVYGESKLAGEREVQGAGGHHLIVRSAWLYGHNGGNFVETILKLAAETEGLQVVEDQVGPPTSATDLSLILKELITARAQGVVNATNSGSCSWFQFAEKILEYSGIRGVSVQPVTTGSFPRPARRPPYSVLSLERLSGVIGWVPRPWHEALRDYIAER